MFKVRIFFEPVLSSNFNLPFIPRSVTSIKITFYRQWIKDLFPCISTVWLTSTNSCNFLIKYYTSQNLSLPFFAFYVGHFIKRETAPKSLPFRAGHFCHFCRSRERLRTGWGIAFLEKKFLLETKESIQTLEWEILLKVQTRRKQFK